MNNKTIFFAKQRYNIMKQHFLLFFISYFFLIHLGFTQNFDQSRVEQAVIAHLNLYPKATLQDIYKSMFQAEFGAEHIISDTVAVTKYLTFELNNNDCQSAIYYEPIGIDSAFYRVHLSVIKDGFISINDYLNAFLKGATEISFNHIAQWKEKWTFIDSIIETMNLNLTNYEQDRKNIAQLLQSGKYAIHHSTIFAQTYQPHYRIIRRDIFEKEILPFLPQQ